ncbi:helix-turn-helix domain-containing protein [Mailhella sp.]|uniref:helix-turn-helix domain-containing protein n=1 Tax=Mailhella sp. TaxID=1981029 RepID=UPI004063E7F3
MELDKAFGVILRELRNAQGYSQEELAEKLGACSHSHICRLESGQKTPKLDMIFRLSEALGISPCVMIQLVEEKHKHE